MFEAHIVNMRKQNVEKMLIWVVGLAIAGCQAPDSSTLSSTAVSGCALSSAITNGSDSANDVGFYDCYKTTDSTAELVVHLWSDGTLTLQTPTTSRVQYDIAMNDDCSATLTPNPPVANYYPETWTRIENDSANYLYRINQSGGFQGTGTFECAYFHY
jgi:hypothetical protein